MDIVHNESASSSKRSRQQDEVSDKLNTESDPRRASSRPVVKRVPYVGGSGGGLARKNSDSLTMRKPVHERWYYDQVPSLAVKHSVSEDKPIDTISLLAERISEQLTTSGDLQHGALTNGERRNGELFIANQSHEFTQVPELTFSFLDWVSEHHHHPFTVVLEFPNAIDPDHPMNTIEDQDMEVLPIRRSRICTCKFPILLGSFQHACY